MVICVKSIRDTTLLKNIRIVVRLPENKPVIFMRYTILVPFMKPACALIMVIAFALFASGCTSTLQAPGASPGPAANPAAIPAETSAAPQAPATPAAIPDITGTWNGTTYGYTQGIGFSDYGNGTISMIVEEQHGRVFSGRFDFKFGNMKSSDAMSGIISADGKTLSLVEENNGYTFGTILGNEIELTYLSNNKPFSTDIDTLKRV